MAEHAKRRLKAKRKNNQFLFVNSAESIEAIATNRVIINRIGNTLLPMDKKKTKGVFSVSFRLLNL